MTLVTELITCVVCEASMKEIFVRSPFTYLRCGQCAHVTTTPYPTRQQMGDHYRKSFLDKGYREAREHVEVYQSAMAALAAKLAKRVGSGGSHPLQGKRILDVGCFTGEFLIEAKRFGAQVHGLELQEEAVSIANSKLGEQAVISADVIHDQLPWSDGSFDVITLLGLVEHITDPDQLITRVHSLLRPGGILMIQTPDSGTLLAKILGGWWPPYTPVEHIHLFSKVSITRFLEQSGFQNITIQRHVKWLTLDYVYGMLRTFGPRLRQVLAPVYTLTPTFMRRLPLPFYIGEMVVFAQSSY